MLNTNQNLICWIKTSILVPSIVLLFSFADSAYACSPIIPLVMIYSAPLFSLFGIVILKMIIFILLERSIPWYKAVLFIIIANIFSSIVGVGLGFAASAPTFIIFSLLFVFVISWKPAKRFIEFNPWNILKNWTPGLCSIIITVLYFITFVLFGIAQEKLSSSITSYWMLKFCYLVIALIISIGLTSLWEEWVISRLSKQDTNYIEVVLKVNLISFLIIMAFFAARSLPERLKSENFLISF